MNIIRTRHCYDVIRDIEVENTVAHRCIKAVIKGSHSYTDELVHFRIAKCKER